MLPFFTATAVANPNIAFVKYWGNRDESLRLPMNGSISMNLDGLETRTTVIFSEENMSDTLTINQLQISGMGLERVSAFLDLVRNLAGTEAHAEVSSLSNFPADIGIASSASAFAALALAATKAAGLDLTQTELSRLARRGSGSACRSIPEGFVEWELGIGDLDSFARSVAPSIHWDLVDCITILSTNPKTIGSSLGHLRASSSPIQAARVADAPRRLLICRNAILKRDFSALAEIVELDSDMMHSVMMTSQPALFYWQPATLTIMQYVRQIRGKGVPVCYTVDAGPNVHVITESSLAQRLSKELSELPGVKDVRIAKVGGPTKLLSETSI